MLTGGTLKPVYQDVKNRAEAVEKLNKGADFKIDTFNFSGLCSIRDLADGMYQVSDMNRRKLWTVTVKAGVAK